MMKLDSASVGGIILVSISFIFILTCLDWILMSNFQFWKDPDLLYRYWIILSVIVAAFSAGLAFMAYLAKLPSLAVVATFLTPILMYAGGLLDQFFALFSFAQNQPYDFYPWAAQEKWFGFWNWGLQLVWSAVFYGLLVFVWYKVVKR